MEIWEVLKKERDELVVMQVHYLVMQREIEQRLKKITERIESELNKQEVKST